MSQPGVPEVLSVVVSCESDSGPTKGSVVATLSGRSISRTPLVELETVLASAIQQATQEGRPLILDFRHVGHFNSSTISGLIQLSSRIGKTGTPVCLRYDGNNRTQHIGLSPLRVLVKPGGLFTLTAATSSTTPSGGAQ